MQLHVVYPQEQLLPMTKNESGYFAITLNNVAEGTRYYYQPEEGKDVPDPASHYQPEGVHGPSEVVHHTSFAWEDAGWCGLPFNQLVLYELHVGTFTPEGTFEAIIPRLDYLAEIGVNAIELMPVAQFPGTRNWGYDGVFMYAVQNNYGGPEGLKKLVNACHKKGIAVLLDVVYNHLGPEGNYLGEYGPYFTGKYHTPWGDAINFDGEWSDGVRDFFADNITHWFTHYHIDGLRADAIHEVYDRGAVPFWEYCYHRVQCLQQQLGRPLYMIAESDLNSPRVIKHPEAGGFGFTAQWLDDLHHALYVLLHEEGQKHYIDFGRMQQLAKAYKEGFVHSGEWVQFRNRRHGASSAGIPGSRFVTFSQNHDIAGNRPNGERLSMLVDYKRLQLAAAAVLLGPYVPLLFMGEEFGATTPFFFFADHSDEQLRQSLREGRKKEFEAFQWDAEPPDALDEKVFADCKLNWQQPEAGEHRLLLQWYKALIQLRQTNPLFQNLNKNNIDITVFADAGLAMLRQDDKGWERILCLFNFSDAPVRYTPADDYQCIEKLLDAAEAQWHMNVTDDDAPLTGTAEKGILLPGCSVQVLRVQLAGVK
ncbi:malto-oligosyltrehalose trehalohydrolase [Filimonas zeae]|uniref:Malto-oligosyltrehalose trehalohydrolase n=2 Tax=Filimonas zeae TaxID=1737353 RepID=A0A917IW07_9BACT|nr:malto-oligosyltrehalose trehalohydrolase [Filimonas zeae]